MDDHSNRDLSPSGHRSGPSGAARWWSVVGAVAIAAVGVGVALFIVGSLGGSVDEQPTSSDSIEGVWILESYGVDGNLVPVPTDGDLTRAPQITFHETFSGVRDSFASADERGTAGTYTGFTGCNKINHGYDVGYEYSAGFLVLEEAIVEAAGCGDDARAETEAVMLAMLWNSPDGIEVVADGDTMTWYGSNLHGPTTPLTFRRLGTPAAETPEAGPGPITRSSVYPASEGL